MNGRRGEGVARQEEVWMYNLSPCPRKKAGVARRGRIRYRRASRLRLCLPDVGVGSGWLANWLTGWLASKEGKGLIGQKGG